ncbi:MAG: antibiotic biosynthesis monooxygenase [Leptospiraceae bacterium]|nr:antibiotic biosynthesis monooxygenase [Leptospiraceae bacterium]
MLRMRRCFAVIFSSLRSTDDPEGYAAMAERMERMAAEQPGFLGVESVRDSSGRGITVSYWESLDAVRAWRAQPAHIDAQKKGKAQWYREYRIRVCEMLYESEFPGPDE